MSLSSISRSMRERVRKRDAEQCRYCRLREFGQGSSFHINHVVPRSKGGTTVEDNLVLQCPHCSLHKSNTTAAIDAESGSLTELFHPLLQQWSDHFGMEPDGTLAGLTATGRVTIKSLRMNDLLPQTARRIQVALGILA